jgi:hypothetical protein
MRWNEGEERNDGALEVRREDRNRGRLVSGLVLMTLGTIFLLSRLEVLPSHALSIYWPLILIAIGVGKLLGSERRGNAGSGLWLIFVGLWAEANVQHWFGLNWHNSWPLFLIFAGLCVLVSELSGTREARDAR